MRPMKKLKISVVLLMVWTVMLSVEVKNAPQPAKGEWDFNLQKLWVTDDAGDNVIGGPGPLLVGDDGTLYVRDWKNNLHFIFDSNGTFIKTFAKNGEGPGEIRRLGEAELFFIDGKVIIADLGKIHYFSKKGDFIKSVLNSNRKRMPHFFINRNEFVYAPIFKSHMPGNKGEIAKFNLETGKETVLVKFTLPGKEKKDNKGEMIVGGLTPMMTLGYGDQKLYYGMNDASRINVADMKGKELQVFTLDRNREKITRERKKAFFSQWGDPPDVVEDCVKSTPDELTYFVRIEVHHGLIYVFKAFFGNNQERQQIDIFNGAGKYLYRAFLNPGKGLTIYTGHLKNMIIKKGFLYLVVEDSDGNLKIAKYKITLPGE